MSPIPYISIGTNNLDKHLPQVAMINGKISWKQILLAAYTQDIWQLNIMGDKAIVWEDAAPLAT